MHPALVAPHLPEFAQAWCQALYEIRDNEEKDSAFRGLCTLVQTNPAGMAKVRIVLVFTEQNITIFSSEPVVVLQFHHPLESTFPRAEQYVPDIAAGLQAARRSGLVSAGCFIPACNPGAVSCSLRSIKTPDIDAFTQIRAMMDTQDPSHLIVGSL